MHPKPSPAQTAMRLLWRNIDYTCCLSDKPHVFAARAAEADAALEKLLTVAKPSMINLSARRGGPNGHNPLTSALMSGRLGAALILLRYGARPDESAIVLMSDRRDALGILLMSEGVTVRPAGGPDAATVARALVRAGAAVTDDHLLESLNGDNVPLLRVLLEARSARKEPIDSTLLHSACHDGWFSKSASETVALLLRHGACATALDEDKDDDRCTAAHVSASTGDVGSLKLLLDAEPPVDPSSASASGKTLLMAAAGGGGSEPAGMTTCVLLLLKRGADATAVAEMVPPGGNWFGPRPEPVEGCSAADHLMAHYAAALAKKKASKGGEGEGKQVDPADYVRPLRALLDAGAPVHPSYAAVAQELLGGGDVKGGREGGCKEEVETAVAAAGGDGEGC